jgi:hypothetical protein
VETGDEPADEQQADAPAAQEGKTASHGDAPGPGRRFGATVKTGRAGIIVIGVKVCRVEPKDRQTGR